jgi:hypothetical protein
MDHNVVIIDTPDGTKASISLNGVTVGSTPFKTDFGELVRLAKVSPKKEVKEAGTYDLRLASSATGTALSIVSILSKGSANPVLEVYSKQVGDSLRIPFQITDETGTSLSIASGSVHANALGGAEYTLIVTPITVDDQEIN